MGMCSSEKVLKEGRGNTVASGKDYSSRRASLSRPRRKRASFRRGPGCRLPLRLGGRGLMVALRPEALLLVVRLPAWLVVKEGSGAKACGALATPNQKRGRALAGGGKAAAVQIWRERVWAFRLTVRCLSRILSWTVPLVFCGRREKAPALRWRSTVRWKGEEARVLGGGGVGWGARARTAGSVRGGELRSREGEKVGGGKGDVRPRSALAVVLSAAGGRRSPNIWGSVGPRVG